MEQPAESIAAASIPIVFYNGEYEVDIGNIHMHPSLGFKRFKALVSQKIGISPQQISTSLVRRKKFRSSPDLRRKVPIDESSDFAAISREKDCFVLATLKRPRRKRSHLRSMEASNIPVEHEHDEAGIFPVKSILKRDPEVGSCVDAPFDDNFPRATDLERLYYDSQVQYMQWQREMYLMSMAYFPPIWLTADAPVPPPVAGSVVCKECLVAEEDGREPDFHWCVYDAVTVGFRSAVGPIERPSKKHIETWF